MLTSLSIKNFALIEHLSIQFNSGFSVITGETGAGKSILLGALGLVLGKRADLNSLKDKEIKCVIEAAFDLKNLNLKSLFSQHDIDYDDYTIIRREILPTGKSRAFVNDTPINLSDLQVLGDYLIDIHSQNQTRELSQDHYQFEMIDAIASNHDLLVKYQDLLKNFKKQKSLLKHNLEKIAQFNKEKDYNIFLLNELEQVNLSVINQAELEQTLNELNNVDFLNQNIEKSLSIANDEQFGCANALKEIKSTLQKIADKNLKVEESSTRIESLLIEFLDIMDELSSVKENLVDDPEKSEAINNTLQQIYNLQKKHQVNSVEELIDIEKDLSEQVFQSENLETTISDLKQIIVHLENQLNDLADEISKNRKSLVPNLISKLEAILSELGMPNAQFKFEFTKADGFLENGKDQLELLFSANKGSHFGLMKKVASGGEMSRIMLAFKSILSQYNQLPTIIFDEIDTGVSGEIANKMAVIMNDLSKNMQVFSITHLPQIASKGIEHFKVFKQTINDNTISEIKKLSEDERVQEIAEMLSGKDPSDSAINHAKSLLN